MGTTTAAVYVRISSDRSGKAAGVRRQLADCETKARDLGLDVVEVITDNDTSASDRRKRRPGYRRLLELVETGTVGTIVVWNVDRLYRRPTELEHLLELVDDGALPGGIVVVTAGELDLNSVSGRLAARILVSVAKGEAERIAERVAAAQAQAAAEGRPHGGRRPIGFEEDGQTIYEPEANLLREAADRIVTGDTLHNICTDWNSRGLSTPRGAQWRTPTLRGALLRPRIVGKRTYQGQVVGDATWPPIVSESTWRRLTAILTDPERVTNRNGERSWLSGLLRCDECGQRMIQARRSRDRARIFTCRKTSSGGDTAGCGSNSAMAERVEGVVAERIRAMLTAPGALEAAAEATDEAAGELAGLYDRVEAIQGEAAELGLQLLSTSGVQRTAVDAALVELAKRESQVESRISALSGRPEAVDVSEFAEWISRWDELSVAGRREITAALVDRVRIVKAKAKGQPWDDARVVVDLAAE